jgi:hypothetical protein
MELRTLCEITARDHDQFGGASRNLVTGEPPISGFMVSTLGNEKRFATPEVEPQDLARYLTDGKLTDFRRTKQLQNCYLGTWYSVPVTCVDISVNVPTLGEALDLARKNKQLAIYDVTKGVSIRL